MNRWLIDWTKDLLPPILRRWAVAAYGLASRRATVFTGHYPDWASVEAAAKGYSHPEILARTRQAVLAVKHGTARFERDSVTGAELDYSFPALATVLWRALENGRQLDVVDFGGSLGSSYFQFRGFLGKLERLRWAVVEQPNYVACGNAEIAEGGLSFHQSIDEALRQVRPDVFLASSVLQYLPDPYGFVQGLTRYGFEHLLIDRTAFLAGGGERLTLQRTTKSIHDATYPAWFLDEGRLLSILAPRYRTVFAFDGQDRAILAGGKSYYRGFLLQRR